jgi:NAD(P) transhydrogenase subunit alpha
MYAKNVQNLLALLIDKDGTLTLNMDDDIVAGTVITDNGDLLHEGTRARMMPSQPAPTPAQTSAPTQAATPVPSSPDASAPDAAPALANESTTADSSPVEEAEGEPAARPDA